MSQPQGQQPPPPTVIYVQRESEGASCATGFCIAFLVSFFFSPIFGLCVFCCFRNRDATKGIFGGVGLGSMIEGIIVIIIGAVVSNQCKASYELASKTYNSTLTFSGSSNFTINTSTPNGDDIWKASFEMCAGIGNGILGAGVAIMVVGVLLVIMSIYMYMNDKKQQQVQPINAPPKAF
jgi:membrane-bound metal-dependent hydrolase YbcI (DUF457 family)